MGNVKSVVYINLVNFNIIRFNEVLCINIILYEIKWFLESNYW